ncbi:MAG TPA: DUF2905 domain-containing protein [Syntrophorhabdaceae bacterium]|nr:DUF2905 domain-containing protein [Syntrophorhabdaceae bacterium]
MPALGKMLIVVGIILIVVGLAFVFGDRIPFLGRLPGDIYVKKERFSFYFPLTTSIIVSIILSLIFWFFRK